MIDHERARELASLSRDPGLDPVDDDQLNQHLAACEDCRLSIAEQDVLPPRDGSIRRHVRLDRQAMAALIRRPAFIAAVATIAVVLVVGGLAWNAGRSTSGSAADAGHASPTASSVAGPGVDPSGGADPWASLEPSTSIVPLPGASATPTAVLTALGATGAVVPLDAGFRLASVDATPASRLAARLTVQPSFAFSIKPEADDRAALLTPAEPLQPGVVYRFTLSGAVGELLDSWAFQARQPLRVVGTLPDNQATDVPVDTGIEITFDQDGVTGAASHVTVTPATSGRFEQHGRTVAFVPDHPLAPATLYSVTVSRGVTVGSTGEATEAETRFKFETAATTAPSAEATFAFSDQVVESPTATPPIIGLWAGFGEDQVPPKSIRIEVYRLADLDSAVVAFRSLRSRPDWSQWSKDGLVDTTKLLRVVSVDAQLNPRQGAFWVQLPDRLPAGWYVVQQPIGKRPIQTVLQVTDVAGYLAVSDSRTLVWANDLKGGRPIVGATATSDGTTIGRTDAQGLAMGSTPRGLLPQPTDSCAHPCDPVVTVRTTDGRAIFLPAATPNDKSEGFGNAYYWYAADPGYWNLLHTDRSRYRPTDTINAWGVLRGRDNGKVPAAVTVRLTPQPYDDGNARPPAASLTARPGPTGAFTGSFPLAGLAEGNYSIDLLVGTAVVRTTNIIVGPIAKPAYRLEIETGRRVYVTGDRIKATVSASFYEGTPVPGVPLQIGGDGDATDAAATHTLATDVSGTAIYRTTAKPDAEQEGPRQVTFQVNPARAEEAEITGASRDFIVFPSRRTVDAIGRFANGEVRVSGSVHLVAIDRLESQIADGKAFWDLDPRGAVVPGATVTARFVQLVRVRTQIGTEYDFIEKKVVPAYSDGVVEHDAGSVRGKTATNGTYTLTIPAAGKVDEYKIIVTVSDTDGHVARMTTYASRRPWSVYNEATATLDPTDPATADEPTFGIGDRVDLTMSDPDTKQAADDGTRYLFFRAQRGIHDVTIQSSPRFITTFQRWAVPNMQVGAVRFTGRGYVGTVAFGAQFRSSDRRLQVDLTAGAARYAPGEMATVGIRTRDASGAPIAATVILQAVDEKLFSIGAALSNDPLGELYAPVQSGIVGTYESHRAPRSNTEGGDTTGGGGEQRDDFRDALLFTTIVTDASGHGSVSFRLSDDLTSWRVSASAITGTLEAGSGSVLVPVGLPFFADASIAPEYLLADRPSIAVRAFGSAVSPGDAVTIEVTSKGLGYDSGPIQTVAFETTAVPLPPLQLGIQTLSISATTGTGSTARTDRLVRSFTVVDTHLTRARTTSVELPASGPFTGGDGLTSVVISDAGAARYLPLLTELASGGGARLDRGLAADVASSLLASHFGSAPTVADGGTFVASRYQTSDGGLALMPYASSDLELSALVALVAPDRVDRSRLDSYLRGVRRDVKETRERQMFALAGLASLGEPVLPDLRLAAADTTLTIRERLMLGLGAAAIGDAATARSIATALAAGRLEQLGGQARLRVGSSAPDITTATALMAVLSADLGDPLAPMLWSYVEANPVVDQLEVLPAAAYATSSLARLPIQPASFAYTVDGTRTVVTLEAGRAFELTLTAGQLAALTIERTAGSVGVTTSWREPIRPTAFQPDPDVTISRSVTPSTSIVSANLVTVDLAVTFGPQAAAGCHQVTELVPSGLAAVGSLATWIDPDSGEVLPEGGVVLPYDQSGPRVFFCAEPSSKQRIVALRYYARVVTPGTYAWEPAIAESRSQEGRAALTEASAILIR